MIAWILLPFAAIAGLICGLGLMRDENQRLLARNQQLVSELDAALRRADAQTFTGAEIREIRSGVAR